METITITGPSGQAVCVPVVVRCERARYEETLALIKAADAAIGPNRTFDITGIEFTDGEVITS